MRIYHLALRDEWAAAVADGEYRRSTLGVSLDDEGFIHCSFAEQVQSIADLVYRGRDDVVLLEIDTARIGPEVRVEQIGDSAEPFPHIYGALPVQAVVAARPLERAQDGRLDVNL